MMEPLIEVENLRYRYEDGTLALDGVNFRLYRSETVALLGANGSGKTTFALHLNGLLAGDGRVTVCGLCLDEKKNLALVRRKIGLLFQDSDEQLFMPTVIEDVAFGLLNLGYDTRQAEQRARDALEKVGMMAALAKAPYHLSAGEKKRVALAGVLVMEPEILVLDEPTTYLDPPAQRGLVQLLEKLPQAKIVITHDTALARALASRAAFFEAGKVVADGPVGHVAQQFQWDSRAGSAS